MSETAKKFDKGKARYDLIPPEFMDAIAKMYGMGAVKYGDGNWEKGTGLAYSRLFSALMRHAWAFIRGETFDPVDGQHHMLSVAWCAIAVFTFDNRIEEGVMGDDCDDRSDKTITAPTDYWNDKRTLKDAAAHLEFIGTEGA